MSATVLITDGEQRAALAAVRALGRRGDRVLVTSLNGRSLAGASRHAAADLAVADPLGSPIEFVADIERVVRQRGIDVLIPLTDASLLAVLAVRDRFAPCRIPFPDLERVLAVGDKRRVVETAAEVGIASPAQRVLGSPVEARALDRGQLAYPLVLKPARSVGERDDGGRQKHSIRYAAGVDELAAALRAIPGAAYPLLLQQRVVGPGVGIFLLVWGGELKAVFAHRRIREKPPSGGVSVYRESIAADPDLVARSRALLDLFGWQGVAMVEYKLDAATGRPYLMEVNGRFWGSLQLAIDAGVDFPALLVDLALGGRPAPVTTYQVGVRSRWWWGDVDHLLARLRRSNADLALPPDAPSRLGAVRDFFRLWRAGDRNEILRLGDLGPFLRETLLWLRGR